MSDCDGCKGGGTLPSALGAPDGIPPGGGGSAVSLPALHGVIGGTPKSPGVGTVLPGVGIVPPGGTPGPDGGRVVPGALGPAVPGVVPVVAGVPLSVPDVVPSLMGVVPGTLGGGTPNGVVKGDAVGPPEVGNAGGGTPNGVVRVVLTV